MVTTAPKLCAHCRYRPVPPPPPSGGPRPKYCSGRCYEAACAARTHAETTRLLNELRSMLGLPAGGGGYGNRELRRIIAIVTEKLDLPDTGRHRGRRRVLGKHGTQRRYKQGCSCSACRAAETAYRRDLKRRTAEQAGGGTEITPLPGHSERAA